MPEERSYTQHEHEVLVAIARVETLQCVYDEAFKDHTKDNEEHFERLYDADKKILDEITEIPGKMTQCSEKIKTETLAVARREFVSNAALETYKGDVKESISGVKGSIKTTSVVLGIFQTLLLLILATWLKSKGLG